MEKSKSGMWKNIYKSKLSSALMLSGFMFCQNCFKTCIFISSRKIHLLTNSFIKLPHIGKLKPDVNFRIKAQSIWQQLSVEEKHAIRRESLLCHINYLLNVFSLFFYLCILIFWYVWQHHVHFHRNFTLVLTGNHILLFPTAWHCSSIKVLLTAVTICFHCPDFIYSFTT